MSNPVKTVIVQIGNSDDKLTQKEWSKFVARTHGAIWSFRDAVRVHFMGSSSPQAPWQNVAWVLEVIPGHENRLTDLKARLAAVRSKFKQDSVAWTVGETKFI